MSARSDFFGARNPQAVLKHGVLTRYAYYFAGRAGRASRGKVAFIDGYAGTGRYDDGSPGSPLLLASEAQRVTIMGRDVRLAFVEQDAVRRASLRESLTQAGVEADQLLGGAFQDVAAALLERYTGHAILLFVDPFGLAIDRATLARILKRRSRNQPIDVLYHFSLSTVARMGSLGVTSRHGSEQAVAQLNAALGAGTWERAFQASDGSDGAATRAAIEVAGAFARSIEMSTGMKSTHIPVRQRPDQLPRYLLVLFSGEPSGRSHWDFADHAGLAHIDWLHHCSATDLAANLQRDEAAGVMSLFEAPPPEREDAEKLVARDVSAYFEDYLPNLLRERGTIRPVDDIELIYGDMMGKARSTHLRAALKSLHAHGMLDDACVGDYWSRTLAWIGR